MKTIIKNYNNARRASSYWISIMLLGLCWISWEWIIGGYDTVHEILVDSVTNLVFDYIPYVPFAVYVYTFLYIIYVIIVTLLVSILNYITTKINYAESNLKGHKKLWGRKETVSDCVVGAILTAGALSGTNRAIHVSEVFSLISIKYLSIFLIGVYLYWNNVLPLNKYNQLKQLLRADSLAYEDIYYSISNADYSLSSFSTFLWKGKMLNKIVDSDDLTSLGQAICEQKFTYYIILINPKTAPTDVFINRIENVLTIPHAKLLILIMGDSVLPIEWKSYIDNRLSDKINVKICFNTMKKLVMTECIDLDINETYGKVWTKRNPLKYIKNPLMQSAYLNSYNSPDLCKRFLTMIIHKLEYLPAIYALFDYIDLQYRLSLAININTNEVLNNGQTWMEKNYRYVGNIWRMADFIEESTLDPIEPVISNQLKLNEILTDEEFATIHKYLPNYSIRTDKITTNTVYLTKELRNVLRGHGSFKLVDTESIYELIFKLALMNSIILDTNNIRIIPGDPINENGSRPAYGSIRKSEVKNLFPFLCYNKQQVLLVFNNYYKTGIEYIDYLDGTLILPSFTTLFEDDV